MGGGVGGDVKHTLLHTHLKAYIIFFHVEPNVEIYNSVQIHYALRLS